MSESSGQSSPLHPRSERAQAALTDALALTTAADRGISDDAAASIVAEYLISTPPDALLPTPRRACARSSLVDLLAGCAFLAQLLRSAADAPEDAADGVWELLDEVESRLCVLVTGGAVPAPLEELSEPLDLDVELQQMLTAPDTLPVPSPAPRAETWASAAHRLRLPVDTPSSAFMLLQAGFGLPGAPAIADAVQGCVVLCRLEPGALGRTAAFQLLIAAWALRALADACARACGRSGDELLGELGILLARRRSG